MRANIMVTKYTLPLLLIIAIISVSIIYFYGRSVWVPVYQSMSGKETLASVIEKYGERAEKRLIPYFETAGVVYPPKEIKLLALKEERFLELWAKDTGNFKKIRSYPVRGASGNAGPKLVEGDKQVPEGKYKIIGFNPNSSYHLSMKLNYPNDFDLYHARKEKRNKPGSNIFIHGKTLSIGCLAMGDRAIEELFTLVHKVGKKYSEVIIAPYDPREKPLQVKDADSPSWLPELYGEISEEFSKYIIDET